MPDGPAFRTHTLFQKDQSCFFLRKRDRDNFPFPHGKDLRRIIIHQFRRPPQDPDLDNGILPQNQMIDQFRAITEGQTDPGLKTAVGDTPVICGTAVHGGDPHRIPHHLFGIEFSIDLQLKTQRTAFIGTVNEDVIESQTTERAANPGKFRQFFTDTIPVMEKTDQSFCLGCCAEWFSTTDSRLKNISDQVSSIVVV